jgi:hypothetical protein
LESGTTLGLTGADGLALLRGLPGPPRGVGRSLDDYIETQVHGVVDLGADAEALVLDPSFRGTATGDLLVAIARDAGIGVEWHAGFQLTPPEVPAEFRATFQAGIVGTRLADGSTQIDQRSGDLNRLAAGANTLAGSLADVRTQINQIAPSLQGLVDTYPSTPTSPPVYSPPSQNSPYPD